MPYERQCERRQSMLVHRVSGLGQFPTLDFGQIHQAKPSKLIRSSAPAREINNSITAKLRMTTSAGNTAKVESRATRRLDRATSVEGGEDYYRGWIDSNLWALTFCQPQ